jgi:hypothetical protein
MPAAYEESGLQFWCRTGIVWPQYGISSLMFSGGLCKGTGINIIGSNFEEDVLFKGMHFFLHINAIILAKLILHPIRYVFIQIPNV